MWMESLERIGEWMDKTTIKWHVVIEKDYSARPIKAANTYMDQLIKCGQIIEYRPYDNKGTAEHLAEIYNQKGEK